MVFAVEVVSLAFWSGVSACGSRSMACSWNILCMTCIEAISSRMTCSQMISSGVGVARVRTKKGIMPSRFDTCQI